jgi:hypothetical protein
VTARQFHQAPFGAARATGLNGGVPGGTERKTGAAVNAMPRAAVKLGSENPKWITAMEVTNTYRGGSGEDRGFRWFSGICGA